MMGCHCPSLLPGKFAFELDFFLLKISKLRMPFFVEEDKSQMLHFAGLGKFQVELS